MAIFCLLLDTKQGGIWGEITNTYLIGKIYAEF